MQRWDVIIVGGGHGGAQAAIALRTLNVDVSVAILTDEPELPYERPPLSKDYLAGQKEFGRLLLRPATFWSERRIDVMTGRRVASVDAAAHEVTLADGTRAGYGTLVWAAGGAPRLLTCPGHDLAGVHSVRTRADVDRLKAELDAVERVVVVGGGYIGLEAAAVLTKLGKQVTVLEAAGRVLSRVAGEPLSTFFEEEHRRHGVDVRLGATVTCIDGRDGRASGVRLADGEFVPADLVIVGIGIVPAVQPLLAVGAEGGNGVQVDEHCRTSLPDVYAIGDCALHRNRYAEGDLLRLESVQNANDMAVSVARTIMGGGTPYDAVPWFWSNQYDLKLQTVGLSVGYDDMVVRGRPADRVFTLIYLRDRRVVALDCVNTTRDYVQGKALILGRAAPDPGALADTGIALKSLAAAAA